MVLTASTATNRLTLQAYDPAGNLLGDTGESHAYDALNMTVSTDFNSGREFSIYDANDERIAVLPCAAPGGVVNCNSSNVMISLRDENAKVLRQFDIGYTKFSSDPWRWVEDYVYRNGILLGAEREVAEGGRRHFHVDHLGTPRLVTNDSGVHIAEHDYYPFGTEITALRQETLIGYSREEPMKFTGQERDFTGGTMSENSTYADYMHARSTSPAWARFMSVDLAGANLADSQSWNRYSYVRNNPIRRVDPDGNADVDYYVLMDPAKYNPAYDRQWFANRLSDELAGSGHTLHVSTDNRNSIAHLRKSFGHDGGFVGYFGHSEGIHLTDDGYVARGLNPRGIPGQVGITNQQLTSMINAGNAGVAIIAACATSGCFAGGGLNGQTTVVALQSPSGLTNAIAISGALEAFNNIVLKANGTVAQGVAAANAVFKKYKMKDRFAVVGGNPNQRVEKDEP